MPLPPDRKGILKCRLKHYKRKKKNEERKKLRHATFLLFSLIFFLLYGYVELQKKALTDNK